MHLNLRTSTNGTTGCVTQGTLCHLANVAAMDPLARLQHLGRLAYHRRREPAVTDFPLGDPLARRMERHNKQEARSRRSTSDNRLDDPIIRLPPASHKVRKTRHIYNNLKVILTITRSLGRNAGGRSRNSACEITNRYVPSRSKAYNDVGTAFEADHHRCARTMQEHHGHALVISKESVAKPSKAPTAVNHQYGVGLLSFEFQQRPATRASCVWSLHAVLHPLHYGSANPILSDSPGNRRPFFTSQLFATPPHSSPWFCTLCLTRAPGRHCDRTRRRTFHLLSVNPDRPALIQVPAGGPVFAPLKVWTAAGRSPYSTLLSDLRLPLLIRTPATHYFRIDVPSDPQPFPTSRARRSAPLHTRPLRRRHAVLRGDAGHQHRLLSKAPAACRKRRPAAATSATTAAQAAGLTSPRRLDPGHATPSVS